MHMLLPSRPRGYTPYHQVVSPSALEFLRMDRFRSGDLLAVDRLGGLEVPAPTRDSKKTEFMYLPSNVSLWKHLRSWYRQAN